MLWDIFCRVIDNYGDVGVCWRLAAQLGARGHRVRLRIDDGSALAWMAPEGDARLDVLPFVAGPPPGDVVIEAFGCELPEAFQSSLARKTQEIGRQPAWLNLEYLTAESFAERSHGLPSPVMTGPAAGLVKRFFYPGFTSRTGGLLRETDLMQRQRDFDASAWLAMRGIRRDDDEMLVSLFCYEPAGLPDLLHHLAQSRRARVLVTAGRAATAVRQVLQSRPEIAGRLRIDWLPLLPHSEFDHLLWACDLNFVRGEDSLVRALWAGKPFVWQIYPQHDDAHRAKLEAFLDWLDAPASWRVFHRAWNEMSAWSAPEHIDIWASAANAARQKLLAQDDLVAQLERFVAAP